MSTRFRSCLLALSAALLTAGAPDILAAQEVAASRTYSFEEMAVNVGATTSIRDMVRGETHSGFLVDMHVTELAAGQSPHAPHSHVHEEMLLLFEGQLDVTIAGKTTRLGPGSAAYVASKDEHGWRNVGATPARYFVVALGTDE